MSSKKGLGSAIYSDTASFGRIWALVVAIFGTVLGTVMVVSGIYVSKQKDPDTATTTGTIEKCDPGLSSGVITCTVDIPELKCLQQSMSSPVMHSPNAAVKVYYDPKADDKCASAELQQVPYTFVGLIVLAMGLLLIGGVWLEFYLTRRYKIAAAAVGAHAIVKNVF